MSEFRIKPDQVMWPGKAIREQDRDMAEEDTSSEQDNDEMTEDIMNKSEEDNVSQEVIIKQEQQITEKALINQMKKVEGIENNHGGVRMGGKETNEEDEKNRSRVPILIIRTQFKLKEALNEVGESGCLNVEQYIIRKKEKYNRQNIKFKAIIKESEEMIRQLHTMSSKYMTKEMKIRRLEFHRKLKTMKKKAKKESRKIEKLLNNEDYFKNMLEKAKKRKVFRVELKQRKLNGA